jgi:hypothetical protein
METRPTSLLSPEIRILSRGREADHRSPMVHDVELARTMPVQGAKERMLGLGDRLADSRLSALSRLRASIPPPAQRASVLPAHSFPWLPRPAPSLPARCWRFAPRRFRDRIEPVTRAPSDPVGDGRTGPGWTPWQASHTDHSLSVAGRGGATGSSLHHPGGLEAPWPARSPARGNQAHPKARTLMNGTAPKPCHRQS